jgi:hypothetical protein
LGVLRLQFEFAYPMDSELPVHPLWRSRSGARDIRMFLFTTKNYLLFTDGSFDTRRSETVRPSNW